MKRRNSELGVYSDACIDATILIRNDRNLPSLIREALTQERKFTSLGSVALGDEDTKIYVGLKRSRDSIERVARELYAGDKILEHSPKHINTLPLFNLPVLGEGTVDLGVLTEDFTENGTRPLTEQRYRFPITMHRNDVPEGLHRDIYDALDGDIYREALGHAVGTVDGQDVLFDFDDIAYPNEEELERYRKFSRAIALHIG